MSKYVDLLDTKGGQLGTWVANENHLYRNWIYYPLDYLDSEWGLWTQWCKGQGCLQPSHFSVTGCYTLQSKWCQLVSVSPHQTPVPFCWHQCPFGELTSTHQCPFGNTSALLVIPVPFWWGDSLEFMFAMGELFSVYCCSYFTMPMHLKVYKCNHSWSFIGCPSHWIWWEGIQVPCRARESHQIPSPRAPL